MEKNQIYIPIHDIRYEPAKVKFVNYEECEEACLAIAETIKNAEVTPENIKDVKKVLAHARQLVDALNKRKIDVKEVVLLQYKEFEQDIKQLQSIVSEADEEVRSKVRELEEAERESKEKEIHDIWAARISHYDILTIVPNAWDFWLKQEYLNKSYSISKVESNMVDWLETKQKEIEMLKERNDGSILEYKNTMDMYESIKETESKVETLNRINFEALSTEEQEEPFKTYKVYGNLANKCLVNFMKENDIRYEEKN